jgi:hypothetical protein
MARGAGANSGRGIGGCARLDGRHDAGRHAEANSGRGDRRLCPAPVRGTLYLNR